MSAGRMGANPYDPLTTTNSDKELIMADANHKARPPVTERSVTIQESWRYQKPARLPFHMRKEPPTFPWMKLSGRWIETAGFEPGQRVRITVEHQRLIITPL
ncbi:SymE family type I addiction module toxin [Paraburkholderia sediminicola]|jgi:toxic protein SymE|uniref:SymE family type I addiction module toxin n=2 Tax=Paraburkholderia sediminicola TaxID=458836 RepID=UPI0038B784F1